MSLDQQSSATREAKAPFHIWAAVRATVFQTVKKYLFAPISKNVVLDLTERAIILILFVYFAHNMLPRLSLLVATEIAYPELLWLAASTNLDAALLVTSELLGVLLILLRRFATIVSTRPLDWALSLLAVNLPLLVTPTSASTVIPSQIPSVLMFAGMIIQISAKVALWRSFGVVPANRGIKTRGPYRLVRHPMYAGYTLTHIGFLLGFPSLQNAMLYLTALLIDIMRLIREERILNHDTLYRQYAARVTYRLLPPVF